MDSNILIKDFRFGLSIKLNCTSLSLIVSGPVAQPGRVPDFYQLEEIRLSRVRFPTGPLISMKYIVSNLTFNAFLTIFVPLAGILTILHSYLGNNGITTLNK